MHLTPALRALLLHRTLAGWIIDPQKIKPGVRMPQHALDPHDLRALLEYLESLK